MIYENEKNTYFINNRLSRYKKKRKGKNAKEISFKIYLFETRPNVSKSMLSSFSNQDVTIFFFFYRYDLPCGCEQDSIQVTQLLTTKCQQYIDINKKK